MIPHRFSTKLDHITDFRTSRTRQRKNRNNQKSVEALNDVQTPFKKRRTCFLDILVRAKVFVHHQESNLRPSRIQIPVDFDASVRTKGDLSENGPEWRAQKHVIYILFLIWKRLSTETAFGFLSEER